MAGTGKANGMFSMPSMLYTISEFGVYCMKQMAYEHSIEWSVNQADSPLADHHPLLPTRGLQSG